jgi:hypothetical protein
MDTEEAGLLAKIRFLLAADSLHIFAASAGKRERERERERSDG